ncbi:unnamed protein product, partial [Polarella glacialis]
MTSPETAQKVRELQKSEPAAVWQWHVFCDAQADGIRDPERLPASLVTRFLSLHSSGVLVRMHLAADGMSKAVRQLQTTDPDTLRRWSGFCKSECHGILNPRHLPADLVHRFLLTNRVRPPSREPEDQVPRVTPELGWSLSSFHSGQGGSPRRSSVRGTPRTTSPRSRSQPN